MKKITLLLVAFGVFTVYAQQNSPWQSVEKYSLQTVSKIERTNVIIKFDTYALNLSAFKSQLQNAPLRGVNSIISSHITYFPNTEGEIQPYRIYEAPVMHNDLQEQFPDIRSYVGVAVNNKFSTVRFSISRFGVHAMILSPKGTVYIDPYTADLNHYMVYRKKDAISSSSFECLTAETEINTDKPAYFSPKNAYDIESNTGIFRTYRLGLACTIEYAQYHINLAGVSTGTVAERDNAVLSAMNVTMTRVNGLFERDMSLTMVIVPNNANVIFYLPEKPDALTNNEGGALINEIQPIMNAGIGSANYDIGHVFSTGGGGIAQLNSPCSSNKARGVTGQGNPIGDPFDVDYVAHEMGHQYGATHTQNNNCNRTGSTAVEPGSATTILGYAGICAPNVQSNSDDHFHAVSMAQMDAFVAGSGNCSVNSNNNNSAPVIQPIPNYTIPRSTAFILPGNATDADGDALTYCWEQIDNQVSTQPPVSTATGGPNFRSISPQTNPDRYIPTMPTILTGATANTWEVVPSVARTMNFALTVRDNEVVNGGQTARANMTVTTAAGTGPFVVNTPNTNVSWLAGSNQTVTWDVAGTTANGVNCANVDIYLSQNGGSSFQILLASKVPNDGSETVSIPATTGTQNRIMVKGNKNIFLDVSNTNFTVTTTTPTFALTFDGQPDGQNKSVCQGQEATYSILYSTIGGFSGTTVFSVTGNPAGTIATLTPTTLSADGTVQLQLSNTVTAVPGVYQMVVTGTSGAVTKTVNLYVDIKSFEPITPVNPLNMAYGVNSIGNIVWNADTNASTYDYELATDLAFSTIIASGTVSTNQFSYTSLTNNTNYFWRVLPKNESCTGEWSAVFRFTTGGVFVCSPIVNSTNVPLAISASGTPTVNSTLTIPSGQNQIIDKLTVTLNITHTWVSDLTVTLISPTGTEVQLFSGQCNNADNAVATFDDNGVTLTCQGSTPTITGTLIPAQSLSNFIGQNSEGLWTLRVFDAFNVDGGSINSWGITFCSMDTTPLACGAITTTWTGSLWTNGRPVNNVAATIAGNYTSDGDLACCSLAVTNTAQVTLQSGHNFIVSGAVAVAETAAFTVENNANLIQIDDVANTGNITVHRNTSPLMRLDYAMWSTPVTGSQTLKQFSNLTLNNRFYTYGTSGNVYTVVSDPANTPFAEGTGYLIRMPDNHPATPTAWSGQFTGIPKNGTIEVPLTYLSGTQKFNAIGNPYPSTISAESFLNANQTDLEGIIYFWRKTNNTAGTSYASYTLGGATTTSPTSPIPNGTIQVGQGFIVGVKNVVNPTASFSNALRVDNNNNQFFRSTFGLPYLTQTTMERHRIWLNLTNYAGLFSQMMVGYMSSATNEVDAFIDGKYIGDSDTALSSLLAGEEYVIQGRVLPFETTDVVPLVFKTSNAGSFMISLGAFDGLFEGDQAIYLRDNLLGIVHDLREAGYSFETEAGVFSNRFDLLYENVTLGVGEDTYSNSVQVATGGSQLKIKSTVEPLSKITVYDVLGRTLFQSGTLQQQEFVVPGLTPLHMALFVKIVMNNGQAVLRKVVF
jgi:subtilisin-like proprotein convertase family protein